MLVGSYPQESDISGSQPWIVFEQQSRTGAARRWTFRTPARERVAPVVPVERLPAAARIGGLRWQRRCRRRAASSSDVVVVGAAMACAQMVRLGRPVTDFDPLDQVLRSALGDVRLDVAGFAGRLRVPLATGGGCRALEEYRRVAVGARMSTIGVVAVTVMIFRPEYARGLSRALAFPLGLVLLLLGRSWRARPGAELSTVEGGRCVHLGAGGQQPDRRPAVWSSRWTAHAMVRLLRGRRVPHRAAPAAAPWRCGVGNAAGTRRRTGSKRPTLKVGAGAARWRWPPRPITWAPKGLRELSWELDRLGVDLVVSPGMVDVAGPRLTMRPVAGLPLIHIEKPHVQQDCKKLQKRVVRRRWCSLSRAAWPAPLLIVWPPWPSSSPAGGRCSTLPERIGIGRQAVPDDQTAHHGGRRRASWLPASPTSTRFDGGCCSRSAGPARHPDGPDPAALQRRRTAAVHQRAARRK